MRLRFLLRPGWLALTLTVFVFAVACFTLLAPWQFSRNAERSAQNAALEASFTAAPRPLAAVLPGPGEPTQAQEWSRVSLTGRYLPEAEVIARLRTVQGEPAFEVLTPLRTDDGTVVLVDRGYLRPDQRSAVPAYPAPPTGPVTVLARVRADETDGKNRPVFADASTDGRRHSYVVDSRVVAAATGLPVRAGYVQLDADQPGGLGALPLPLTDEGPFLSYALQWIAFGAMALGGWLYFTVRELRPGGALTGERERRRSVAEILAEDEAVEAPARS